VWFFFFFLVFCLGCDHVRSKLSPKTFFFFFFLFVSSPPSSICFPPTSCVPMTPAPARCLGNTDKDAVFGSFPDPSLPENFSLGPIYIASSVLLFLSSLSLSSLPLEEVLLLKTSACLGQNPPPNHFTFVISPLIWFSPTELFGVLGTFCPPFFPVAPYFGQSYCLSDPHFLSNLFIQTPRSPAPPLFLTPVPR